MTEPTPHDRLRSLRYRSGTMRLAIAVAGTLLLVMLMAARQFGYDRTEEPPKRYLDAIEVAEGEQLIGDADLGYRFAIPKGFVPAVNGNGADIQLVPRAWQPVYAYLGLRGVEMKESVTGLSDSELADFALESGDTHSRPDGAKVLDTLTAADGSRAVWIDGNGDTSTAFVYHDDRAVHIEVSPPAVEDDTISGYDEDTFPAALRALVSTMEFA